ncbi:MAG: hypothetical protein ACRDTG_16685 [Pseudonocardiaceae bacterium]
MNESETATAVVGQSGIGYCIHPDSAVPPTVLVADMANGAMLLQGWPVGPSAYVCAANTAPLREALATAFGSDSVITDKPTAVQAQP